MSAPTAYFRSDYSRFALSVRPPPRPPPVLTQPAKWRTTLRRRVAPWCGPSWEQAIVWFLSRDWTPVGAGPPCLAVWFLCRGTSYLPIWLQGTVGWVSKVRLLLAYSLQLWWAACGIFLACTRMWPPWGRRRLPSTGLVSLNPLSLSPAVLRGSRSFGARVQVSSSSQAYKCETVGFLSAWVMWPD